MNIIPFELEEISGFFYFRTLTTQCKLLQKKSKNSLLWRKTEIRKEEALPPLPEGRGLRA